jgi:hypothetical protein
VAKQRRYVFVIKSLLENQKYQASNLQLHGSLIRFKMCKFISKLVFVINEIRPEPGLGSLVRIRGHQRRLVPTDLVYVLNDDEGLTDWLPVVHLEKQLTLVPQVLLFVLVYLIPFLGTILNLIPNMLKKGIH